MERPSRAATMSLPRATSDSDKSILMGSPWRRGKATAMGLVPNKAWVQPQAGIAAGELLNAQPVMPFYTIGCRCSQAMTKGWQIGIGACRGRDEQDDKMAGVAGPLKKKKYMKF